MCWYLKLQDPTFFEVEDCVKLQFQKGPKKWTKNVFSLKKESFFASSAMDYKMKNLVAYTCSTKW